MDDHTTLTKSTTQTRQGLIYVILAVFTGVLAANNEDLKAASELESALLDRLELNSARIHSMADGLCQVAELHDPIAEISELGFRPSVIPVGRMLVPLGVVGIIY